MPEVFAYDAASDNEAGVPYMLGTTARTSRDITGSAPSVFGTAEQDKTFREQMARIQAELLSFSFAEIGSLYYSKEMFDFFNGPDLNTGKGPWSSASDYYYDLTNAMMKRAVVRYPDQVKDTPPFTLPALLNHLLNIYSEVSTGPFRLSNLDLGAHNIY